MNSIYHQLLHHFMKPPTIVPLIYHSYNHYEIDIHHETLHFSQQLVVSFDRGHELASVRFLDGRTGEARLQWGTGTSTCSGPCGPCGPRGWVTFTQLLAGSAIFLPVLGCSNLRHQSSDCLAIVKRCPILPWILGDSGGGSLIRDSPRVVGFQRC